MEATVREPARDLAVLGAWDVAVAGGGMAGVAAAVSAAREGVSVCLLEKSYTLGGLATTGNVTIWLPLCDGAGRQVIAGLPEELLKLSVSDLRESIPTARFMTIPECWLPGGDVTDRRMHRYQVEFNSVTYLLALEKLVIDSGVKILYDTRVCDVVRQDDAITHLVVENKSGRTVVDCRTVIDATGDADISYMAGEETESLDSNVLAGWFYYLDEKGLNLHQLSKYYSPNATRDGGSPPFFRGDDADDVSAHVIGSRQLIREKLADIGARQSEGDVLLTNVPTTPCFRMTRRLVGSFSLGSQHVHRWFDDSIGFTGDWRKSGPVYAIPWRSLRAVNNRNLLVVGRCISADTTAWDVTRAIPGCAVTGTAAGTGAALAIEEHNGDIGMLEVSELQCRLRAAGFLLDPKLVEPA